MSHRRVGGVKMTQMNGGGSGEDVTPLTENHKGTKTNPTITAMTALHLDTPEDDDFRADDGSLSMEERFKNERHKLKTQHWKDSAFAVGLTEVTWADERQKIQNRDSTTHFNWDDNDDDGTNCLCFSAAVCPYFNAGRVGNMVVLKQSNIVVEADVEDEETGEWRIERISRPKLDCVVGPYWPMLFFVTYPLIFTVSGFALFKAIPGKPLLLQFCWAVATISLIVSLALTSFRDPGIMHRRHACPENRVDSWRWSDQAQTFRPRGAIYDPDTGVVVEGFDHTCPWTGTAIGRKNMLSFQFFVCLVFVCMVFDILLLTKSV